MLAWPLPCHQQKDIQAQLRERSEQRREAEARGDVDEVERLDEELEQVESWYRKQVDRKGRPREVGSDVKRMRTAVLKAITGARASIREHLPALERHLDKQLSTGEYCRYRSTPAITWSF